MVDRSNFLFGSCRFRVLVIAWGCLVGGVPRATADVTVDFEDLPLEPESFYNGSDGAGGFVSRGAFFNNLLSVSTSKSPRT